jgi:hypothetical protein
MVLGPLINALKLILAEGYKPGPCRLAAYIHPGVAEGAMAATALEALTEEEAIRKPDTRAASKVNAANKRRIVPETRRRCG